MNKILRIAAITVLAILGLLLAIMLYFNSTSGKKQLSHLVFNTLSKQIGTPIKGTLDFSIPDWIQLNNLLILDQQSDTLLYAHKAHLDVGLFMLFKNELLIEQVELEGAKANLVKRGGKFNFDYIIDAFSSDTPQPKDTSAVPLKITLKGILAQNLKVNYQDSDLEQFFKVDLGYLKSGFHTLDLDKNVYELKDSEIKNLWVNGALGNSSNDTTSSGPLPSVKLKHLLAENINWNLDLGAQITQGKQAEINANLSDFDLANLGLNQAELQASFAELTWKEKKSTPSPSGEINFSDIKLVDADLAISGILWKDSLLQAQINKIHFKEQSGFELAKASAGLDMVYPAFQLKDLVLKTPKSSIESQVSVQLDTHQIMKSKFEARLKDLSLAASEAYFFANSLKKNETFKRLERDTFTGKGSVYGTFEDIYLEHLALSAPTQTRVTLHGKIENHKQLGLDLEIRDLATTQTDLNKFAGSLPENISLPDKLVLNGRVKGTLDNLKANAFLNSTQGGARLDLNLQNVSKVPQYQGEIFIENYAAGKLIKNDSLGLVEGSVRFAGTGFTNPSVNFEGAIDKIGYGNQQIKNIALKGNFANNVAQVQGNVKDSNIDLDLDATVDLSRDIVKVIGNTQVNKVNLKALGLTSENISLAGDFDIHNLLVDTKKPYIDFKGKNITLYKDEETFSIGDLSVLTEYGKDEKRLDLTTPFMNLSLSGNFEYDKLQHILTGEVNKYFKIPEYVSQTDTSDFYFDIKGNINYHPVFSAFLPALKTFQPISINSGLKSDGDIPFSGNIQVPYLQYDSIQVINTQFVFEGNGERLKYDLTSDQISNPSFRLRKAELEGQLRNNIASFALSVKDSVDKDIHSLAGLLESDGTKVRISFDETGSMLFYENWSGNPYGYIDYSPEGLVIENVVFSSHDQMFRMNSLTSVPNGPIAIEAERLDLDFLSRAIWQDSTFLAGKMDLDLQLSNYISEGNLAFTGGIDIADFYFNRVPLGDLHAKAESDNLEEIGVHASLTGLSNDFQLNGKYYTQRQDALDFKLDVGSLNLQALEPYMEGIAYEMKGSVLGDIDITGPIAQPKINGEIGFKDAALRIQETAAKINIDNQSLKITNSKIDFKNFAVEDVNQQKLLVNGSVDLSKMPDFEYNLDLNSENFLISDSERGQSEYFYGKAYLQTRMKVSGKNNRFKITGTVKAMDNTNLTMLLPDESLGADLNSVVTFVDFRNPNANKNRQTESTINLANAVNINVSIDEKSTVNMLMNPITGDLLTASGNGNLNIGFDNMGELFIIGKLDIVRGSYDLTYQAIQKRFEITPVSKSNIVFAGNPMDGVLDITAEYRVPGRKDLLKYPGLSTTNVSMDNMKSLMAELRVDLVLSGSVNNPGVDFQIVAKRDDLTRLGASTALLSAFETLNIQLLNDNGEKTMAADGKLQQDLARSESAKTALNQNAIMLLITGTFTADQMIQNFTSSGNTGYEDLARRNASQIISSQLEQYASGLIKGVDLDIGLESSATENIEGNKTRSTNLNLGVSKRLANDRIVVAVGKNFELENKKTTNDEIFDNAEIQWLITRDGRYRAKMFRKTKSQSAVEGAAVIENGVGLTVGLEYNRLRELRRKKKKNEK